MLVPLAMGFLGSYLVESVGVTPRVLAPYLERRASGHNPVIVKTGQWLARVLTALDRPEPPIRLNVPQVFPSLTEQTSDKLPRFGVDRQVVRRASTMDDIVKAIASAKPGETIEVAPGRYHFRGGYIPVTRPGTSDSPIVVRAAQPGSVVLELDAREGFLVTAPYWSFENLELRGVCGHPNNCDHAFHVSGAAHHFVARNNRIVDFNSHFKINGLRAAMPDDGVIEGNVLTNSSIRNTEHPVTPIDLVAASRWIIRRNFISDFIKGQSDQISYGGFAKGGGSENRFEQNVVICENRLKASPGRRVGLSLGGGGTGPQYCRDSRCITEQDNSVIASNLIASCSDDGIYINRSAGSRLLHNTVVDTGGIVVRFPESSAEIDGNLVDGSIRTRDEGIVRGGDNIATSLTKLYLGMHSVRNLFATNAGWTFFWNDTPPRRNVPASVSVDLCGVVRPKDPAYGAFEDFSACISAREKSEAQLGTNR